MSKKSTRGGRLAAIIRHVRAVREQANAGSTTSCEKPKTPDMADEPKPKS